MPDVNYMSPRIASRWGDVIVAQQATSVGRLVPGTDYVAQLIVRDKLGGELFSPLVSVRTSDAPREEVVLFSEEDTAGYSIPSEMLFTSGQASMGPQYYEYVSICEGACFENLRRQQIGISLANMTEEEYGHAYYEFALASSGTEHSY